MCSIIGGNRKKNDINSFFINECIKILNIKGGDYHSCVFKNIEKDNYIQINKTNDKAFIDNIFEWLEKQNEDDNIGFLFFSRLTPEMENAELINKPQPYNNTEGWVVVHGTIPNTEEVFQNLKIDIKSIDTDIFTYLTTTDALKFCINNNSKIACISTKNFIEFDAFHTGLGLYYINHLKIFTNINYKNGNNIDGLANMELKPNNKYTKIGNRIINNTIIPNPDHLCCLYSGGLDITASLIYQLRDHPYKYIDLIYFDYGTRASKQEINAGKKMVEYLKPKYPDIKIEHIIIENFKTLIDGILKISNIKNLRLTDKNASGGGHHEAESAISYVPYRNTLFMITLGSLLEQKYPNKSIDILIGLNLSEGMIYSDNATPWLEHMNYVLKYGGQKTNNFNIIAPFVTQTKTKIIEFLQKVKFPVEISYSCYFPDENGNSCGKCGSCLLRENAILRNKED